MEGTGIRLRTGPGGSKVRRRACLCCAGAALLAALLLAALPEARLGALALCNRLFERSEAVNAYVYERFAVPPGQGTALAAALLVLLAAALAGCTALWHAPAWTLACAALIAIGQAWLGLSLPAWANALLLLGLGVLLLPRPWPLRAAAPVAAGALALILAVWALLPGVHAPTEAASERVRDWLGAAAAQAFGGESEEPGEALAARHVHTQSLSPGAEEARLGRAFRLITIAEEEIARPHWVDYLKIALLLLLAAALVGAPFLPFVLLAARRRRARERRAACFDADATLAVRALFRHVNAMLTACGHGAGAGLYRQRAALLAKQLPEEYARLYAEVVPLYEEAAYSDHALGEEQRRQAERLLGETDRLLFDGAGRRQRFYLRYVECLHE